MSATLLKEELTSLYEGRIGERGIYNVHLNLHQGNAHYAFSIVIIFLEAFLFPKVNTSFSPPAQLLCCVCTAGMRSLYPYWFHLQEDSSEQLSWLVLWQRWAHLTPSQHPLGPQPFRSPPSTTFWRTGHGICFPPPKNKLCRWFKLHPIFRNKTVSAEPYQAWVDFSNFTHSLISFTDKFLTFL